MRARWPGIRGLRAEFERVRVDMLMRCVRRDTLRDEVRNMRERMRKRTVARATGLGQVRHQAGCGRHRRHRVPGAVLGAAARRHPSAGGDVRRHHPPARIGGLRRPGARRPPWTCSPTPIEGIASAPTTCRSEQAEPVVPAEEFADDRAAVTAIWNATMGCDATPDAPIIRRHASHQTAHPAQRAERIQGGCQRSAARVPDAARCICGTRIRASICRSSRPAGRSARTAAPSTRSRSERLPASFNVVEAASYVYEQSGWRTLFMVSDEMGIVCRLRSTFVVCDATVGYGFREKLRSRMSVFCSLSWHEPRAFGGRARCRPAQEPAGVDHVTESALRASAARPASSSMWSIRRRARGPFSRAGVPDGKLVDSFDFGSRRPSRCDRKSRAHAF